MNREPECLLRSPCEGLGLSRDDRDSPDPQVRSLTAPSGEARGVAQRWRAKLRIPSCCWLLTLGDGLGSGPDGWTGAQAPPTPAPAPSTPSHGRARATWTRVRIPPSPPQIDTERWPSGLRHAPGERVYPEGYRGFESHSLRHPVCCCRDFEPAFRNSPRNSRDSAGFWPSSPGVSEPETAGSGPRSRRSPCFSLLPSWAVRFRSLFASATAEAQQTNTESPNPTLLRHRESDRLPRLGWRYRQHGRFRRPTHPQDGPAPPRTDSGLHPQ